MENIDEFKQFFSELSPAERSSLLEELYLETENLELTGQSVNHCPHCGGEKISKYGFSQGQQRYRCATCNRTFKETTGTVLQGLRNKEVFLKYAVHMLTQEYLAVRKMAEKFKVSPKTSFQWRHRVLVALPELRQRFEKETQLDDLWFRYSQKGRKGLKYARTRGTNGKKGDNEFSVKLVAASDGEQSEMKVAKIGRVSAADLQRTLGDKFSKSASIVSDKHPSIGAFAKNNKLGHSSFKASEHTDENGKGVQLINNIAERIETFVDRQCKVVATKYLQLYANWFNHRENAKHKEPEGIQQCMLKNKNGWDVFANIEKIYERFIKNHSKRTYRCPTIDKYKANNWNQEQAVQHAFF